MPIRIYALAKQLNLDSKTLVDLCGKAGVTGKGSALANLSDEEAEKVKQFLSASGKPRKAAKADTSESSGAPTSKPRREDLKKAADAGGKLRVLPGQRRKAAAAKESSEDKDDVVLAVEVDTSADPTKKAPSKRSKKKDSDAPPSQKPDFSREQVMRAGGDKPVPVLDGNGNGKKRPDADSSKDKPSGPTIKLAPIPKTKKPAAGKKSEPAAQKPEMRLSMDAIRAGRLGEKPLSEHLEKKEKKHRAKKAAVRDDDGDASVETPGRKGRHRGGDEMLGGREQRQLKRKRTAAKRRKRSQEEEDAKPTPRVRRRIRRTGTNTAAPRKSNVVIELPCTVRTFSEAVGIGAGQVLGKLLGMGVGGMLNINAELDHETAELLAVELGVEVDFKEQVALEEKVIAVAEQEDDPSTLKPRPPVITFLGHVDHGKTSLLDRIINIDVVSGEKGGITQHIRAYQIEKDGHPISFVDTPGHEAFTEMRARGANVTDIAVLVIAADDGVMPQTEEAISHAKAAGVPIIVALNKIDLPGVNEQKTFQDLAANELLPSEWGGDIEVIKTSATTGQGIDELLDTILTVAELHEYQANPDRPALGTCIEAELSEGRGVVAKLLVEKGTLHVGDVIVCGTSYGRVKAMYDTLKTSDRHEEAGPSMPVSVTGLNEAPGAGDKFHVVPEIAQAREIAESRADASRQQSLGGVQVHVTLENLFDRLNTQDDVQTLNVILRADVRGSIEAIRKELDKLDHPEVQVKILQATVGGITEADVHLADASDAIIIGFSVVPDEGARQLADAKGVQVRRYDIIYQLTADIKAALEGLLKPEEREAELGRALVQRTFQVGRVGTIAGCRVLAGTIERDARIRVIRDSRVIGDYPLESLRRIKDDAKSVREGYECGMKLRGYNDLKEGDVLEAYRIEEIARTF
ncbi:MAG: translation initiation factor IF-2 [Planctomycetia bacterium]